MSRHRAPRRAPTKGSPLTLGEHFGWTLIVAGYLMVAVLAVAYVAQERAEKPLACEQTERVDTTACGRATPWP